MRIGLVEVGGHAFEPEYLDVGMRHYMDTEVYWRGFIYPEATIIAAATPAMSA